MNETAVERSYICSAPPPNPFDPKRQPLSWCCYECLVPTACVVPVTRDGAMLRIRELYQDITGELVMLTTVNRHLQAGPTHPDTFGSQMRRLGWSLECPVFDGKRQDGKLMLLRYYDAV